jgi:phospholipid/cholesterol/gamma-HCH transport system substrate-binding protein
MSRTERREYLVGVLTFLVLVTILVATALANRRGPAEEKGAMTLTAEFTRADGIYVGAAVRVAGINIGKVVSAVLDGRRAKLTLVLDRPVPLPEDTAAVIETDGVFGQKHIELRPGGEEKVLTSGSRIAYTQDSVIIEDLIARIVGEAKAAHGQDAAPAAAKATP